MPRTRYGGVREPERGRGHGTAACLARRQRRSPQRARPRPAPRPGNRACLCARTRNNKKRKQTNTQVRRAHLLSLSIASQAFYFIKYQRAFALLLAVYPFSMHSTLPVRFITDRRRQVTPCRYDLVHSHTLAAFAPVRALVTAACPPTPPLNDRNALRQRGKGNHPRKKGRRARVQRAWQSFKLWMRSRDPARIKNPPRLTTNA